MIFKRVILFTIFTLIGFQLLLQNCKGLVQKIFELRQLYIIEKSDNLTTFIFAKKEYLSLTDKNVNFIKHISHSLKKELKKTEAESRITLALPNKNDGEISFAMINKNKRKFYLNKNIKAPLYLLRPPII